MKNYLCYDRATGEDFIVEALNEENAQRIADVYFKDAVIDDEISDFEAETLGLDTY